MIQLIDHNEVSRERMVALFKHRFNIDILQGDELSQEAVLYLLHETDRKAMADDIKDIKGGCKYLILHYSYNDPVGLRGENDQHNYYYQGDLHKFFEDVEIDDLNRFLVNVENGNNDLQFFNVKTFPYASVSYYILSKAGFKRELENLVIGVSKETGVNEIKEETVENFLIHRFGKKK